jgi:hypothetical protein
VTYVGYETRNAFSMANMFMHWGAKGYKEAFPIEDADMDMLLTTGDVEFEDYWDDADVSKCYELLQEMQKGETKLHTISNGQVVTLVKEQ